ncbi:MAG: OmpA family protein, partial [Bacteroidia bacterium]
CASKSNGFPGSPFWNLLRGLVCFLHGNYREYLQTQLTQPLEKDKTYRFTMFISLSDYSPTAIDQLGVCFLNKAVGYNTSSVITGLNPSYIKLENKVRKDITNWHRISVTYKSQGGELFILIGSFEVHKLNRTRLKAPKELKSQINKTSERDSYYYIDDVSLVETIPVEEPLTKVNQKIELPVKIRDTVITFKNVFYKTNKSTLLPASYTELDRVAKYLQDNPSIHIEIMGHTDNSGNEKSNKRLSEERAKAVAEYLILKTKASERIIYKGYGSTKPVASNESEEGKAKNRRVEFIMTD